MIPKYQHFLRYWITSLSSESDHLPFLCISVVVFAAVVGLGVVNVDVIRFCVVVVVICLGVLNVERVDCVYVVLACVGVGVVVAVGVGFGGDVGVVSFGIPVVDVFIGVLLVIAFCFDDGAVVVVNSCVVGVSLVVVVAAVVGFNVGVVVVGVGVMLSRLTVAQFASGLLLKV